MCKIWTECEIPEISILGDPIGNSKWPSLVNNFKEMECIA